MFVRFLNTFGNVDYSDEFQISAVLFLFSKMNHFSTYVLPGPTNYSLEESQFRLVSSMS